LTDIFCVKLLSTASWQAMSWEEFCNTVKSAGGLFSGGPTDVKCKNTALGENYYGSNIYATLQLLSTYGLQGDISVKKNVMTTSQIGGGSKPEMQWISLIKGCKHSEEGCYPGISYCSVIPSDFSQLVVKLMNSSIMCAPSAQRRYKASGRTEAHPHSLSNILQRLDVPSSFPVRNRAASSEGVLGFLASNKGGYMVGAGSSREVVKLANTSYT
jgi:hypothetical protein